MENAVIGLTLDRSGSMGSMWGEAVAGYNTFKNDQAKLEGETHFISVYFDNEIKVGFEGKRIDKVPDLTANDSEVFPRGMTALVDATLKTIEVTERWIASVNFTGKVYIVVITDGMENASESSPSVLKEKIAEREAAGWEFIYLAANVDLDATRGAYGFGKGSAMAYDGDSVVMAYASTSAAITRSRSGGQGDLFDEAERDLTHTKS